MKGKKNMNKTIASIGVATATVFSALTAKADWVAESFLAPGVTSICVSNDAAANGVGYTNLLSVAAVGGVGRGTNAPGTMWTNFNQFSTVASNKPGTQIIVTNGGYYLFAYLGSNNGFFSATNAVDYTKQNLLQDVDLWVDREGRATPIFPQASITTNIISYGQIGVKIVGGSGANSAVTFRFMPLLDGTNQSTTAGDLISVTATANTTTPVITYTPLQAQKVIGARRLRLVDISNADADASSSVQVLGVWFSGWRP